MSYRKLREKTSGAEKWGVISQKKSQVALKYMKRCSMDCIGWRRIWTTLLQKTSGMPSSSFCKIAQALHCRYMQSIVYMLYLPQKKVLKKTPDR